MKYISFVAVSVSLLLAIPIMVWSMEFWGGIGWAADHMLGIQLTTSALMMLETGANIALLICLCISFFLLGSGRIKAAPWVAAAPVLVLLLVFLPIYVKYTPIFVYPR